MQKAFAIRKHQDMPKTSSTLRALQIESALSKMQLHILYFAVPH